MMDLPRSDLKTILREASLPDQYARARLTRAATESNQKPGERRIWLRAKRKSCSSVVIGDLSGWM